jgi:hypothetical protein
VDWSLPIHFLVNSLDFQDLQLDLAPRRDGGHYVAYVPSKQRLADGGFI